MERREVYMVKDPGLYVKFRTQRLAGLEKHRKGGDQPDLPALHENGLEYTLFTENLLLWISKYSAGWPLDKLADAFAEDVLSALEACSSALFDLDDLEDYFYAIWTVSIAELLEMPRQTMLSIMEAFGGLDQDALLDRIVRSRNGETGTVGQLRHAEIWLPLFEVFDLPEGRRTAHIDYFLTHFYAGSSPVSWHDYHLQNNAGFFGYWSFELAVVVRALDIADDTFANNIFYPRDLAGREFLPTYLDSDVGERAREVWEEMTKDQDENLSPERIAKAQAEAEKAMRSFFGEVMKGEAGNPKVAEKRFDNAKASFGFLVDSLGLNQKGLSQNPEAAQALIMQMMGQTFKVLDTHEQLKNGEAEGLKPLFMEAYANMEKAGFSTEDILKDLPPEILDQMGGLSQEQVKVTLSEKMAGFSEAMKALMADKTLSPLDMMMGMEALAKDFGYVEPVQEAVADTDKPSKVQKEVSEKLGKDLDDALKDRLTMELNFEDLWTRRDE